MKSRRLLKNWMAGLTALCIIGLIASCSGSDGGALGAIGAGEAGQGDPDCTSNGAITTIEESGGHAFEVSASDVRAGVEKTYSIQGSDSHNHELTITQEDFERLQDNQAIEITSSLGGDNSHTHPVVITCARN